MTTNNDRTQGSEPADDSSSESTGNSAADAGSESPEEGDSAMAAAEDAVVNDPEN